MERITTTYNNFEKKILQTIEANGVISRPNASSGLWLGPLIGLCAIVTLLNEDNSYSEICLLVGITGVGLIMSSICLIIQLSIDKSASKDFQVLYFLPASMMSMLYLLWAKKGLLVSVSWGLSVGSLGTWGVLQVMSLFPKCFTLGEAITVTHGIVLFLLSSGTNFPLRYHLPPLHDDDIATAILQVGIIFVGLLCISCAFYPKIRTTKYFYLTTVGLLLIFVAPLLHILLDQSPLLWTIYYIFGTPRRVSLIIYWAMCLLVGAGVIAYQILSESHATTAGRKSFHCLAVIVYLPGMLYEPTLLYLASGVIMGLFIVLELMRLLKVSPIGEVLELGFSGFSDEKDLLISLSPLYLHVGLSFPLWMPTTSLKLLPLLSGIITIGIGDTAASVIGSKLGKNKWPNSNKSIEGTIACISSQLIFIYGLAFFGFIPGWWTLIKSTLAVIGVSLIEALTDQVDNLTLPFLFYLCSI
ncbi:hypothetical protein PV327_003623 [Microctonus hyperodae]|uniref:dolichol kinase n=2 Tax=Microctonus hyperodae TaxID=165561 RepID=A0AA39L188_MICHY|nr:hypothetical protein PV327_003623 [Microctonus hyperodae]